MLGWTKQQNFYLLLSINKICAKRVKKSFIKSCFLNNFFLLSLHKIFQQLFLLMEPTRILFISQEIFPFLQESTASKICREVPQFVQDKGYEARIFMPCFGNINERRNQLHEVQRLSGMNIIINDTDHQLIIKVASIQPARIQIYFIDNDDFFRQRDMDRDENGIGFPDNDERTIFYIRGVLETIKKLRWTPDIIHCNGWFSAIAPMLIKKTYNTDPFFRKSKVFYSIYNDELPNKFDNKFHKKLMLDGIGTSFVKEVKENLSWESLTKLAIKFSDVAIAGTPEVDFARWEEFAKQRNVPLIPYSDNYKEDFYKMYQQILGKNEEED